MHPKFDVGRLYILMEDGRRGLVAIEDCVELALRYLEVCAHGSEVRLIKTARGDRVDGLGKVIVLTKAKKEVKLQDWAEKTFHRQYLRQTKEVRSEHSCVSIQNGALKRETKILIVVAKNQRLKTSKV